LGGKAKTPDKGPPFHIVPFGPQQLCVYCLERASTTKDHVPPAGWYPDTMREVQRPYVPACRECNNAFGRSEEAFLQKALAAVGPDHPATASVYERNRRSWQREHGRNEKDAAFRDARLMKIFREMQFAEGVPPELGGARTMMQMPDGSTREVAPLTVFPADVRHLVADKLVRGFTFLLDGVPLGRSVVVQGIIPKPAEFQMLAPFLTIPLRTELAPCVHFGRAVARAEVLPEARGMAGWRFLLWERFPLLAITMPAEKLEEFTRLAEIEDRAESA
jgi:hypothetical protein